MSPFIFIKENVQILDVVQEYTTVKRAGLYWKGHCPFHHEKTASFTVSPHKGIFYCFGCHHGGDIITFISKVENCTPLEAVQHIAQRYNIALPEQDSRIRQQETKEKDHYFTLCKLMALWCQSMLTNCPLALSYLHERGMSKVVQERYTIGYFPGGINGVNVLISFMKKHNILLQDLITAGILQQGKNILYSAFEERIIFPITDHLGRFCGFGGRVFKPNDTRAKYYNSKEHHHFVKGSLLFGFYHAKKAIQKQNSAYLVEGYTDCIAMVQHGYENTVATLGTACTTEHLVTLSRYAHQIILLYDGDNAGQEAILRIAELAWQASIDPYVICLAKGEDPASLLQKTGSLAEYADKATDIFMFFVETLGTSFATQPLQEKLRLTRKIVHIIGSLKDSLKRDILLQKASGMLAIPLTSLERELKELTAKKEARQEPLTTEPGDATKLFAPDEYRLEKKIFFAIINNIQLLNGKCSSFLPYFFSGTYQAILSKLSHTLTENPSVTFTVFFNTLTLEEQQLVTSSLMTEEQEILTPEFASLVAQLQRKHWKRIAHAIKDQLTKAQKDGNKEVIEKLMTEFLELKQAILPLDSV